MENYKYSLTMKLSFEEFLKNLFLGLACGEFRYFVWAKIDLNQVVKFSEITS